MHTHETKSFTKYEKQSGHQCLQIVQGIYLQALLIHVLQHQMVEFRMSMIAHTYNREKDEPDTI